MSLNREFFPCRTMSLSNRAMNFLRAARCFFLGYSAMNFLWCLFVLFRRGGPLLFMSKKSAATKKRVEREADDDEPEELVLNDNE